MALDNIEHDELNEAIVELAMPQTEGPEAEEAAERALELVLEVGNPNQREEVLELVEQNTRVTKEAAREWMEEVAADAEGEWWTAEKITKKVPHYPQDEWIYEVDMETPHGPVTIKIPDEKLKSQAAWELELTKHLDRLVEFENFSELLTQWLAEAEIEQVRPEPMKVEHIVAQKVLEAIDQVEVTTDRDVSGRHADICWLDGDELYVRSEYIDQIANRGSREVSTRRLRAILDEFMAGNTKQLRAAGGRVNFWPFDVGELDEETRVDVESLRKRADTSDRK